MKSYGRRNSSHRVKRDHSVLGEEHGNMMDADPFWWALFKKKKKQERPDCYRLLVRKNLFYFFLFGNTEI
jgi:hypothetical protein